MYVYWVFLSAKSDLLYHWLSGTHILMQWALPRFGWPNALILSRLLFYQVLRLIQTKDGPSVRACNRWWLTHWGCCVHITPCVCSLTYLFGLGQIEVTWMVYLGKCYLYLACFCIKIWPRVLIWSNLSTKNVLEKFSLPELAPTWDLVEENFDKRQLISKHRCRTQFEH